MRRFDYHVPQDPPELVIAERMEAIAWDFEQIANEIVPEEKR